MKSSRLILVVFITFVLSGLQGFRPVSAADPMSPQELEYFQKFSGKWGGASWSVSGKTKGAMVEVEIGEIDPAQREAKVTYSLGGMRTEASKGSFRGRCEKDKVFFETANNRVEFVFKGNKLWGTRSGKDPGTIVLNRTE